MNEAKNIASDDENMILRIDPRTSQNPKRNKVYWWGKPVCKITDKDNNLLFLKSTGEPAVYGSLTLAFADFEEGKKVFKDDGTPAIVKMLVDEYELEELGAGTGNNSNGGANVPKTTWALTSASKDDTDGFPAVFDSNDPATRSVITRGNLQYNHTMFRLRDKNQNVTITNLIIDGNNYNPPDYLQSNQMGKDGWIFRLEGASKLTLGDGAELRNSYSYEGGAVFCQNGVTFKMTGTAEIHDCHAVNGGGVFIKGKDALPSFTMEGSAKIYDCVATGSGGGVSVVRDNKDAKFIMTGNASITGCTAAKGAGVYLAESAGLMEIQGNPQFGDGSEDKPKNTVYIAGYAGQRNGGEEVYQNGNVRQDIYIAGYKDKNAESLQVTGAITSGDGTIWVWTEHPLHYEVDKQFAQFSGAGASLSNTDKVSSMKAFRNARSDDETDNPKTSANPAYLFGVEGTTVTTGTGANAKTYININWGAAADGSRRVVLRKVIQNGDNLNPPGDKDTYYFRIFRTEDTGSELDLTKDKSAWEATSLGSGVFYCGELSYGTYYLGEMDTKSADYKDTDIIKRFKMVVDATGVAYYATETADAPVYGNRVEALG